MLQLDEERIKNIFLGQAVGKLDPYRDSSLHDDENLDFGLLGYLPCKYGGSRFL
jgi:hypothetical protein